MEVADRLVEAAEEHCPEEAVAWPSLEEVGAGCLRVLAIEC